MRAPNDSVQSSDVASIPRNSLACDGCRKSCGMRQLVPAGGNVQDIKLRVIMSRDEKPTIRSKRSAGVAVGQEPFDDRLRKCPLAGRLPVVVVANKPRATHFGFAVEGKHDPPRSPMAVYPVDRTFRLGERLSFDMLERCRFEDLERIFERRLRPVGISAVQATVHNDSAVQMLDRRFHLSRPFFHRFCRRFVVSRNRAIRDGIEGRFVDGDRLMRFTDRKSSQLANRDTGRIVGGSSMHDRKSAKNDSKPSSGVSSRCHWITLLFDSEERRRRVYCNHCLTLAPPTVQELIHD